MEEQGKQPAAPASGQTTAEQVSMPNIAGLIASIKSSQIVKIMAIGALILLLQIPIFMISGTVKERKYRSYEAAEEIASKWGRTQHIIGPFITIPYEREVLLDSGKESEKARTKTVLEYANFLPEDLRIHAGLENILRHRGIFDVPVYRMTLSMGGEFTLPDFSQLEVAPTRVLWEQARLNVLIADTRAITRQAALTWNGEELPFEPGGKIFSETDRGIQVDLKNKLAADSFAFSFQLDIQGSSGVYFAPAGQNTEATLASNWSDPSFQGNWLPVERTITEDEFNATWRIPAIGRNFSQYWTGTSSTPPSERIDTFGVDFIVPVDLYRMAERSIKYQFLFLTLTFITLWLFEVLTKTRLHIIQYLLVGAGMCLFYLLELSLAEHLGFLWAYLIASASIVLLTGFYCMSILKTPRRAFLMGGFITLLYGYLYTLLVNQDYALLAGSVGLFGLLGAIMYLTRRINWHNPTGKMQPGESTS
jgi:inner membrane protein